MSVEIHVLSGALAGSRHRVADGLLSVGRAPESGLRFDAERDLPVSARHALLYPEAGGWWVRDLSSRNGTFVNGARASGPVRLSHGDRVVFGEGGPEVEVGFGAAPDGAVPSTGRIPARAVRLSNVRLAGIGTVLVLLLIIAGLVSSGRRTRAAWERERAELVTRLDSVLEVVDVTARSLEGEREALSSALRGAEDELRRTRSELDRALEDGDDVRVDDLRQELQERTAALERQQLAAALDFDAIEAGSRHAVALVFAESARGGVATGTAFAVRPDGTLLTARHLVEEEGGGTSVRRLGVQFSDSEQVFPARIVSTDPVHDLAVLRVDNVLGEVPVIRGFNLRGDTLGAGAPVAVIGFPLGGATGVDGAPARFARPLVSSGVVALWTGDRVEVLGYGAAGASGSPIFDADGRVVAVLFGGVQGAGGHRIFAVPAAAALALVERAR